MPDADNKIQCKLCGTDKIIYITKKKQICISNSRVYNLFISCKQIILSVHLTSSTLWFNSQFCRCSGCIKYLAGVYSPSPRIKKYYSKELLIYLYFFSYETPGIPRAIFTIIVVRRKTLTAHDRNMFRNCNKNLKFKCGSLTIIVLVIASCCLPSSLKIFFLHRNQQRRLKVPIFEIRLSNFDV